MEKFLDENALQSSNQIGLRKNKSSESAGFTLVNRLLQAPVTHSISCLRVIALTASFDILDQTFYFQNSTNIGLEAYR